MAGTSFLIYHLERLPQTGTHTTEPTPLLPGNIWEDALFTSIKVLGRLEGLDVGCAMVTHRKGVRKGNSDDERWFVRRTMEFTAFVDEVRFWAFYDREAGLFAVQGESEGVTGAIGRLNQQLRDRVALRKVTLDLQAIYREFHEKQHVVEVRGAWCSHKARTGHSGGSGYIGRQGLFGDMISTTDEFSGTVGRPDEVSGKASEWEPTYLDLVTRFADNRITLGISSSGNIYFKTECSLGTSLQIIKLLNQHSTPIEPPKRGSKTQGK
ncbi:MAG TPA: hypothetical protein VM537_11050 [Anaerolineae bacterium]|nr:hypothetical protein [Anaerolineae bacterium]